MNWHRIYSLRCCITSFENVLFAICSKCKFSPATKLSKKEQRISHILTGNSNCKFRFDEDFFKIKDHTVCFESVEGNPGEFLKPVLNL